ncbi:MAG: nucleic acid binding OB-fold tRNA/helicase-type [Acidimicrobiales bacterium]|jgi:RecG-like helicase|nr:nucleic acid binding OB-fold tRNA/helicase-type [Acidimicrobiales bacterium]
MKIRRHKGEDEGAAPDVPEAADPSVGAIPIAEVQWRQRAKVAGRVRSIEVQPWAGVPTLKATLVDGTGGLSVVFLGRREVAGIGPGTRMVAEGMVGDHGGRLAMLNPDYVLLASAQEA